MKIGLIAVSGVGAVDQELLRIGLTLPGFVERSKAVASLPSLGLLTLAGMNPAEHEYRYHEIDDIRAMQALPDGFDLVAISSFTARIREASLGHYVCCPAQSRRSSSNMARAAWVSAPFGPSARGAGRQPKISKCAKRRVCRTKRRRNNAAVTEPAKAPSETLLRSATVLSRVDS